MTIPNFKDWVRFHRTIVADPDKKVVGLEFQIEAKDAVSSTNGVDRQPIYLTDIQFQSGSQLTGWIPHTKEMLDRMTWTHNENSQVANPSLMMGTPPRIYENVEKRWFNILGRGHQTIVIPNYFPEDWDVPILPTGIDLTLYPKETFDLLRISTSHGVALPEDKQWYKKEGGIYQEIKAKYEEVTSPNYVVGKDQDKLDRKNAEISNYVNVMKPLLDEHPLHTRYTREFWVDGVAAQTEIKVHASTRNAKSGGNEIKIVGEHSMNIKGTPFPIDRKKFMLAQNGTTAIRLEFYKQKTKTITTYDNVGGNWVKVKKSFEYLEDVGIGYWGTASFYQWTHGLSRY